MTEYSTQRINIEEIKQDLRREVNEKKWVSEEVPGPRMDLPSFTPITIEVPSFKKYMDRFLWKYGIRYAKIIKAIPILSRKAEEVHSRLSRKKTLEEFIFNLQENINSTLYQQYNRQHAAFLRFQGEWKAQQWMKKSERHLPDFLDAPNRCKHNHQGFEKSERHLPDFLDAALLETFRGKRGEIKEEQQFYLPHIQKAGAGTPRAPILDLGCGRGEWLELLKENGFIAEGVDRNKILVQQCRELGLAVTESDIFEHLKNQSSSRFGAVTGFHVLEHLPFEVMTHVFQETVRVLKPGGIAVFETPNPENILVGSCHFHLDPTHYAPLPGPMLKFLAERFGLTQVQILCLHPFPEEFRIAPSELGERFNQYFYGPQDYAVIGVKP